MNLKFATSDKRLSVRAVGTAALVSVTLVGLTALAASPAGAQSQIFFRTWITEIGNREMILEALAREHAAGRFLLIGGLWLWCLTLGQKRLGRAPWQATLVVTLGLIFPDVFLMFGSYDSLANPLGHSILLLVFLLFWKTKDSARRLLYGLFSGGIALHLVSDLLQNAFLLFPSASWMERPWLCANIALGVYLFVKRFSESPMAGHPSSTQAK